MMNRKSVVEAKNINRYSVITQTTSFDHVIMARPAGDAYIRSYQPLTQWATFRLYSTYIFSYIEAVFNESKLGFLYPVTLRCLWKGKPWLNVKIVCFHC